MKRQKSLKRPSWYSDFIGEINDSRGSGVHRTASVLSRLEQMLFDLQALEKETARWMPVCKPLIITQIVWGIIVGIAVASYSGYRISLSKTQYHEDQRDDVRVNGQQIMNSFRTQLETSVSSTRALAALIQVDAAVSLMEPLGDEVLRLQESISLVAGGAENETASVATRKSDIISKMHHAKFNKVAASLISSYKGITNLQMAPGGIVSIIYPPDWNENAIGYDLFFDPEIREGAMKTIRAKDVIFVGPLSLMQNGRTAVLARYPVFVNSTSFRGVWPEDHTWWGFATMLSEIDDLIKHTSLAPLVHSDLDAFVLYAKKGAKRILISASASVPGQPESAAKDPDTLWLNHARENDPVSIPLEIPDLNIDWVMEMWPKDGWKPHGKMYYLSIVLTCFGLLASSASVWGVALRYSVRYDVKKSSKLLIKACEDAVIIDKDELEALRRKVVELDGKLQTSLQLYEDEASEWKRQIEALEEDQLRNLTMERSDAELQFKKPLANSHYNLFHYTSTLAIRNSADSFCMIDF